jgi:hypothetical protein
MDNNNNTSRLSDVLVAPFRAYVSRPISSEEMDSLAADAMREDFRMTEADVDDLAKLVHAE